MNTHIRHVAATGLAVLGLLATAMPAQADNHKPATATTAQNNGSVAEETTNTDQSVGTRAVERKSFKCGAERLSVSWDTSSNASTTVHFNNHCNSKQSIQTLGRDATGNVWKGECFTVNPNTKGKKKIWSTYVYDMTSPKSC